MSPAPSSPAEPVRAHGVLAAALGRGLAFFLLWTLLMQSLRPADLAVGALACSTATWTSLRLLPAASGGVSLVRLLALLPHFAWESMRAGIDVAHRALAPGMPLRPGFVRCAVGFPPGFARDTFATITSLLPGSIAAGDSDGSVSYHCVDTASPVGEQVRNEERRLARALVAGRHDG